MPEAVKSVKNVLIVGNGGRESALAWRLSGSCTIYAVMAIESPTIAQLVKASGGSYRLGDFTDPVLVAKFAIECGIELAIVQNDSALAAGVVDALNQAGIETVGPTRAGAEIEWNKAFSRSFLTKHFPSWNPEHWIIRSADEADKLFQSLKDRNFAVVVKPKGLTGGKGVKVMGEHLADFDAARAYTRELLETSREDDREVIIEEKLEGVEFTLQAITDGKIVVRTPASYDFPFRFEGDTGPGTGGMGAFVGPNKALPFLSDEEYDDCIDIIGKVISALGAEGRKFNGVLNTGFFATRNGLKIMEFNSRFGDPECMNIMMLLDVPALKVFTDVSRGELDVQKEYFKKKGSVVKYLVSPEYGSSENSPNYEYKIKSPLESSEDIQIFFASSTKMSAADSYITQGNSRSVAIGAISDDVESASNIIEKYIADNFSGILEHRKDIGTDAYIKNLLNKRK
jgi:phosphoribosylamine--glycine ligase